MFDLVTVFGRRPRHRQQDFTGLRQVRGQTGEPLVHGQVGEQTPARIELRGDFLKRRLARAGEGRRCVEGRSGLIVFVAGGQRQAGAQYGKANKLHFHSDSRQSQDRSVTKVKREVGDPAREEQHLQPGHDGRVRCSTWLTDLSFPAYKLCIGRRTHRFDHRFVVKTRKLLQSLK